MAFLSNKIVHAAIIGIMLMIVFVPPLAKGVFESTPFQRADAAGRIYVDEAFDRALIAFALARATNAIISVIQDSEVDIAPAGIGVTIAVGEVLDPINDMIERFSVVMLVSLISLGIQKFMIDVVPWFSLNWVLTPALFLFLLSLWPNQSWTRMTASLARRLLVLALLLRFSVPAVAILNEQVYQRFLDQHYAEAVEGLEQGKKTLTGFSPLAAMDVPAADAGLMSSLKETARQLQEATDLRHQIERLSLKLGSVVKDLLSMIVVFLLNTVLLPLCFLWGVYKLFGRLTSGLVWPQLMLGAAVSVPLSTDSSLASGTESSSPSEETKPKS